MNGGVKCVENQGKNNECMCVNCKYVVTVVWNNSMRIKFHSTVWRPCWGNLIFFKNSNDKVFYNFVVIL